MTITDKYKLVCENKLSKQEFSKLAVREFPHFVTPNNTFSDVVAVLKQKGVLNEAKQPVKKQLDVDHVNPYELQKGIETELSNDKKFDKAVDIVLKNLSKNPTHYTDALAGKKVVKNRIDLPTELDKKRSNVIDKKNASTAESKLDKANVKDKKDRHKNIKVKEMTQTPHKVRGVKVMDVPSKKGKTIKLKEVLAECMCELKKKSLDEIVPVQHHQERVNQEDYQYYVIQILPKHNKIVEGFEIKEDAISRGKEIADEMAKKLKETGLKVVSKKGLSKHGLTAELNTDWADPKWIDESAEPQQPTPNSQSDITAVEKLAKFFIAAQNTINKHRQNPQLQNHLEDLYYGLNMLKNPFLGTDFISKIEATHGDIKQLTTLFEPASIYDIVDGQVDERVIDKIFSKLGYELKEDVNLDRQAADADKKATDAKIRALQSKKNDLNKGVKPTL